MKYQRTKKSVLMFIVHCLSKSPTIFGNTFKKWALLKVEEDYPLFYWALKKE